MTQSLQYTATLLFALAILHTFLASFFQKASHRFPENSLASNFFHLLGEVEVVFGIWATLFVLVVALRSDTQTAIEYVQGIDFTEPAFVFVIMAVSATLSVRNLAAEGIYFLSRLIQTVFSTLDARQAFYFVCLGIAPIIGSFITEPAIMTVLALILRDRFFQRGATSRFKYVTLATLFVNVSIGGTLTHFAAPPVVMVAKVWGWDTPFMFSHFGLKAWVAIILSTIIALLYLRSDFKSFSEVTDQPRKVGKSVPRWITLIHIVFMIGIVMTAHHLAVFMGLFMLFLGVLNVTEPHQEPLALRESLLVGFFLAGLVVLGKPQAWWLDPLLRSLTETPLFIGTTLLTAVTDNAALTYLGAQVQGLSDPLKLALLEGAITGGGLTVIANAPNPAGYGILKESFGEGGVNPLKLFFAAIPPTLIAALVFRI